MYYLTVISTEFIDKKSDVSIKWKVDVCKLIKNVRDYSEYLERKI